MTFRRSPFTRGAHWQVRRAADRSALPLAAPTLTTGHHHAVGLGSSLVVTCNSRTVRMAIPKCWSPRLRRSRPVGEQILACGGHARDVVWREWAKQHGGEQRPHLHRVGHVQVMKRLIAAGKRAIDAQVFAMSVEWSAVPSRSVTHAGPGARWWRSRNARARDRAAVREPDRVQCRWNRAGSALQRAAANPGIAFEYANFEPAARHIGCER